MGASDAVASGLDAPSKLITKKEKRRSDKRKREEEPCAAAEEDLEETPEDLLGCDDLF